MTEAEWLACSDPMPMLEFLRGKVSDRKLRLYLCGGCRQLTHLFFRPESLPAVEIAERFADGEANEEELDRAEWAAESPTFGIEFDKEGLSYDHPYKTSVVPRLVKMGALSESALSGGEWQVAEAVRRRLIAAATLAEFSAAGLQGESSWGLSSIPLVDWPHRWLFDCIFGNPFRLSAPLPPVVLNWNDRTIPRIAQGIYEDRKMPEGTCDNGRLAILADALLDAGCEDEDLIQHLRESGAHVRGCWALGLILGKG